MIGADDGTEPAAHWDAAYDKDLDHVSWHLDEARLSLELIEGLGLSADARIIDVGGGTSPLAAGLIDRGHGDITVLDVSQRALDAARTTVGARADAVTWICADLRTWTPGSRYQLWHDRAVLHFLTDPADRRTYVDLLTRALTPGGHIIVATFAQDGPERCSGLPVVRYDPGSLSDLLGPEFAVIDTRREAHRTPRGAVQPFTWLVARRS